MEIKEIIEICNSWLDKNNYRQEWCEKNFSSMFIYNLKKNRDFKKSCFSSNNMTFKILNNEIQEIKFHNIWNFIFYNEIIDYVNKELVSHLPLKFKSGDNKLNSIRKPYGEIKEINKSHKVQINFNNYFDKIKQLENYNFYGR